LVTVDLTEPVAVEAADKKCDAVISYHPPWFRATKSLTMKAGSEARSLAFLSSKGISVYSPHTALDNVRPGINDWVLKILFGSIMGRIIIPNSIDETCGAGRIITLSEPVSLKKILEQTSSVFSIPILRYALNRDHGLDTPVKSLAVCVGSGSSVFSKLSEPVDILLTGEMSHHDLLKFTQETCSSVVLTEHSTMERAYLFTEFTGLLARKLKEKIGNVVVEESLHDHDPVLFYKQ
jgi:dinuclear metal center YbgI/SA1388 family protein